MKKCNNINEKDSKNRDSLYYGIYHNNIKVVRFLLENGISKTNRDSLGKSAVHYVVNPVEFGSFENVEMLKLLHEYKFEMNLPD